MTNFNISLVDDFNQTGAGVLCLKDAVKAKLEEGLAAGNITGGTDALDGVDASLQVIQISHSGSALYNVSFYHLMGGGTQEASERKQRRTMLMSTVHGHYVPQGREGPG